MTRPTETAVDALRELVSLIENAGLYNITRGVQLGATSWYVKMTDAIDYAHAVLASTERAPEPDALKQALRRVHELVLLATDRRVDWDIASSEPDAMSKLRAWEASMDDVDAAVAALATPAAAPAVEPVAPHDTDTSLLTECLTWIEDAEEKFEREWGCGRSLKTLDSEGLLSQIILDLRRRLSRPLYAAPPVEMMTDEQIDEIAGEEGVYPGFGDAVLCDVRMIRTFARAILSTASHTQEKP